MGILDEAIREHLELKRQHGADEPELKQLEDEAFGPPERPGSESTAPDPAAEAPTEFMTQPDVAPEAAAGAEADEPGEISARQQAASRIADLQEAPAPAEPSDEERPSDAPIEEEQPAAEEQPPAQEGADEDPELAPSGPSTEERQVIAEQPTEMFDVVEELAADAPAPSEEELVEEEISGPRLAPVDPLGSLGEEGEIEVSDETDDSAEIDDEDDDFWDEKRLSDELDQALEGPFDSDEDLENDLDEDEDDAPLPPEPAADIAVEETSPEPEAPTHADEDVLEETPDFLEETPEDDELWFEQKPPKDFDFDD